MGERFVEFCCEFCRTCKLFTSQLTSVIAAVLFTVHPVHTEAVSTYSTGWHRKTIPISWGSDSIWVFQNRHIYVTVLLISFSESDCVINLLYFTICFLPWYFVVVAAAVVVVTLPFSSVIVSYPDLGSLQLHLGCPLAYRFLIPYCTSLYFLHNSFLLCMWSATVLTLKI